MLAIVKSAANIRGPLLYNEQKVEQKQALFLDAHNFLQDKDSLTLRDKVDAFHHLTELNERSRQNIIHISVNFPDTDQLSDRQMTRIADDFMHGIGFGDQPWLAYRHLDAGHPHFHVVTTNIRPDGSRISNDLRSPHHLKQLCFAVEQTHGLSPAIPMPDLFGLKAPDSQEVQHSPSMARYGKEPTKKQLESILRHVNLKFSFTSFEAYNAVLSLYNVRADRGREDSPMYRNRGLYYRMIDREGRKLGAPIKASAFRQPVTLQILEQKFSLEKQQTPEARQRLTTSIDWALRNKKDDYSMKRLIEDLRRDNIVLVIPALTQRPGRRQKSPDRLNRKPEDGHGIFYVDLLLKTVTRDTELGSPYTAASILQRTGVERELRLLYEQGKLKLANRQEHEALQPDYPNTAETRRILFKLAPQHDQIVKKKLEQKQHLEQTQRQSLRMRRSL